MSPDFLRTLGLVCLVERYGVGVILEQAQLIAVKTATLSICLR